MTKIFVPLLLDGDDDIAQGLQDGDRNAYEILRELVTNGLPCNFVGPYSLNIGYETLDRSWYADRRGVLSETLPIRTDLNLRFSFRSDIKLALHGPQEG